MYRGFHKFDAAFFERLATIPSTYPQSSEEGQLNLGDSGLWAKVIDGVIDLKTLDHIVSCAEEVGYDEALLNTGSVKQETGVKNTEIRQSKRAIITDDSLALDIYNQIKEHLPTVDVVPGSRWKGWEACGVNPTLRVLKYDGNDLDHFEVHQDGSYSRETSDGETEKSFLTLQIYLSSGGGKDFYGGATRFMIPPARESQADPCAKIDVVDVVPTTGRVLLFQHNIWHEGERLTSGSKVVLRSEIMFRKKR